MKKAAALCLLLSLILSVFSGCGSTGSGAMTAIVSSSSDGSVTEVTAQTPESVADITIAAADSYEKSAITVSEAKNSTATTTITLSGKSITYSGTGVKVSGSNATIIKGGTYILSGSLSDGQIVVNSSDDTPVILLLNGAAIASSGRPALYIKDAKKVILTLAEGTQNSLTDSSKYSGSADENDPNAALFCQSDLTINGKGSLTVTGNFNNAVNCRDILKILNCSLNIGSIDDGIIGRDAVIIENANITLDVEGDGIKATNEEDKNLGYLSVNGSAINVTAGNDGLQAETNLYIIGGTLTITTGGGSQNASMKREGSPNSGWGSWGSGSTSSDDSADDTFSAKGLKANSFVRVSSGNITLDTSDDSIHSNNAIQILGGTLKLASGDDGVHADTKLEIKSGTIAISKSYEGLESTIVDISGGKITVEANDDGINIYGGTDESAMGGRPGENNFSSDSTDDRYLNISGGALYINADGDGLDSNGGITMSGGTVIVDGPINDGNGALDYTTSFVISGGTFAAIGSAGMAQTPSDSSTQYSIGAGFSSTQSAGIIISVSDSSGNVILTVKARKQFAYVVISSPNLKKGTKYTVSYGGTVSSSASYGLITDGSYSGGQSLGSATISSAVTSIGSSAGGGMGGGGMGGGMGGGGGPRP